MLVYFIILLNSYFNILYLGAENIADLGTSERALALYSILLRSESDETSILIFKLFNFLVKRSINSRLIVMQIPGLIGTLTSSLSKYQIVILELIRSIVNLPFENATTQENIAIFLSESNLLEELFYLLKNESCYKDICFDIILHIPDHPIISEKLFSLLISNITEDSIVFRINKLQSISGENIRNVNEEEIGKLIDLLHSDIKVHIKREIITIIWMLVTINEKIKSFILSSISLQSFQAQNRTDLGLTILQGLIQYDTGKILTQNISSIIGVLSDENENQTNRHTAKFILLELMKTNIHSNSFSIGQDNLLNTFIQALENNIIVAKHILFIWVELCKDELSKDELSDDWISILKTLWEKLKLDKIPNELVFLSWNIIEELAHANVSCDMMLSLPIINEDELPQISHFKLLRLLLDKHSTKKELKDFIWSILTIGVSNFINLDYWNIYLKRECYSLLTLLVSNNFDVDELCNALSFYLQLDNEETEDFFTIVLEKITENIKDDCLGLDDNVIKVLVKKMQNKILDSKTENNSNKQLFSKLLTYSDVQIHAFSHWSSTLFENDISDKEREIIFFIIVANLPENMDDKPHFIAFSHALFNWLLQNENTKYSYILLQKIPKGKDAWIELIPKIADIIKNCSNSELVLSLLEFCSNTISQSNSIEYTNIFCSTLSFMDILHILSKFENERELEQCYYLVSNIYESNQNNSNNCNLNQYPDLIITVLSNACNSIENETLTKTKDLLICKLLMKTLCTFGVDDIKQIYKDKPSGYIDMYIKMIKSEFQNNDLDTNLLGELIGGLTLILKSYQSEVSKVSKELSEIVEIMINWIPDNLNIFCFLNICKFLRVIFYEKYIQDQFVMINGFNHLSRAIFKFSNYIHCSKEAQIAVQEAINFLVGSAQVTILQKYVSRI